MDMDFGPCSNQRDEFLIHCVILVRNFERVHLRKDASVGELRSNSRRVLTLHYQNQVSPVEVVTANLPARVIANAS
jgi:hypothetical protein